jgi:hypothetical protein
VAGIQLTGLLLALPAFFPIVVLLLFPRRAEQMAERYRRRRLALLADEGHRSPEEHEGKRDHRDMDRHVTVPWPVPQAPGMRPLQLPMASTYVMTQRHAPTAVAADKIFP